MSIQIEQGIARGWGDERIALHLNTDVRSVIAVRRNLDELVDADLFDSTAPHHRLTKCKKGHRFTPENTYQRPAGTRECRICKSARNKQRDHAARRRRAA